MADNHLTVAAIKVTADGALGSRGAWMLEPYADSPPSTGLNTTPMASIEETAKIAAEQGFQLCIHAIGDRANREVLNVYEATFKAHPDKKDLRWRIEHAQHINAADIPRFGKLGVIASMQGIHCHVRRALRAGAPRAGARRGRRLRLAEADEDRRRSSATAPTCRSSGSIRSRTSTRRSRARRRTARCSTATRR